MKTAWLPVAVGRAEAICLRILLSGAVLWSIWKPSKYGRVEDPAGLARWGLPVAWIGQPGVHPWLLAGTALAGLLYVAGVWRRGWLFTGAGLLGLSVAHVSYWTLANCQGNTFHGSQMMSLVLLAQLSGWAIMARRARQGREEDARWPSVDGVLLYFSQCAIAAVYVTSAITKLLKSGGRWVWDSPYLAKSVQKVWKQLALDNPSDLKFTGVSPWAEWLAANPMGARLLFAPGFFLELFAFVLIWNRAWAAGWGLALILMHFGISVIMQLEFPEFQALVFIFCVNLPAWLLAWQARRPPAAGN